MQIIKQGRKSDIYFRCWECGCEYIADVGECKVKEEQATGFGFREYYSNCPNCHYGNRRSINVMRLEQKTDWNFAGEGKLSYEHI